MSIETLERALSLKPEIWDWNRIKPNRFGCFDGKVEHVVFRYPAALQSHLESIEFPIWRDWKPCIEPLLREAVKDYGYSSGCVVRIMLAKLLPHCQIGAHVDKAPSAEVPHKIHIPIQTSQEAVFICEGRRHHLERGWAYEVNNRVLHGGANGSSRPRIHLIFDYYERTEGLACNLQSL